MENEVTLIVNNPEAQVVKLVAGDPLYFGSEWIVQKIFVDATKTGGNIEFKNNAGKPSINVPFKFSGNDIQVSEENTKLKAQEKEFEALLEKARTNLIEDPKILQSYANAVATYEKVVVEGNRVIGSGEYGEIYAGGNIAADAQRQIWEIYKNCVRNSR